MKCQKCQFENPEGSKFCEECGRPMELLCPQCGQSLSPRAKFCNQCGQDLRQPEEAPPVDYSKPPSYTPKHLADQILTSRSALEGERKIVTVLFADVANYTALSEKLDPEEVHLIMDGCFQILMDEIHRYEGTVNQFTGDGVMALFGAPLAHEDHAQRACHAALAIQRALTNYGEQLKKQYDIDFRMRIGLNSGLVVVGKIGDDLRMDYTAIGDTTNLASRMQSLASPGTILASSHTYHLAQDFFSFQSFGEVPIRGKEEPQQAYQLLKESAVRTRLDASASRGLTRFIGREKEMQILSEAYEKARSGSGHVVSIVGEAGVGKSRLLLEFRQSLPPQDLLYLEGRCLHYGSSMAYLPLLDILRSYLDVKEGDREALIKKKLSEKVLDLDSNLQSILPPFQELLSMKVEDQAFLQLDPRQKKERTFEALRDLFLRESQERPLILSIEDLHWLDKASEEFLGYLIDWLAKARILLLLLYRPEYTHAWANKSYYHRISLDQLTLDSSAELVQAILEGGEVASDLRQLILERAAGNPLFMEELTHSLLENGSIQRQDHRYVLIQKPSEISVPDTIQGVIASRMDRLEESNKRTLQAASVIGREFAYRILQAISERQEELKSHLLHLQGLEFIYEKSLFPELEYIFKHALTQEVAYNSLLHKRRKDIHERIGRAIEDLYGERLEEFYEVLAYHFEKAGETDKAVKYLHLAGERATRLSANEEAIACFHRGLELLQTLPESKVRDERELDLQLGLMAPLAATKGWSVPGMRDVGSRALDLARRIGDTARAFSALGLLRHCYLSRAEIQTTLQISEELLHLAQCSQDPVQNIVAHWAMGVCLYYMGELDQSRVHLERVVASYDPQKHPTVRFLYIQDPGVQARSHLALIHLWMGYLDQALQRSQESLALARRLNHPFSLAFALNLFCRLHYDRCEPQTVQDYAVELMQVAIENKFPLMQAIATFFLGWCRVQRGEVKEGIAQMEQGVAAWQMAGMKLFVPWFAGIIAGAQGRAGQVDKGLVLLDEAITQVGKTHERIEADLYRIKAELLQSRGEITEAKASFCQAIEVARRQQAKFWELQATLGLSRLLQQEGRSEEARQLLSEIYAWFTEGFDTPDLKEAKALLDLL